MTDVIVIEGAGRYAAPDDGAATYRQQLTRSDLSVGTYSLSARAVDDQSPHTEDEVYVVTAGRAGFTGGDHTVSVGPGTVLFVPAGEPHHFHDIAEDLAVLVFFAPAYGTRGTPS